MGISITPEISSRFTARRQELRLTQLELEIKSKVSLRTIQNLEKGRRDSFRESILIELCRALDMTLDDLLDPDSISQHPQVQSDPATPEITPAGVETAIVTPRSRKKRLLIPLIIGLLVLLPALFWGYRTVLSLSNSSTSGYTGRIDWITDPQLDFDVITPEWSEWSERWKGVDVARVLNHLTYKSIASAGDTIGAELQWSYHCVLPATPMVYISAYREWDPDTEIRIFDGVLSGDSTIVRNFEFVCPNQPGVFDIRVFYAEALAPIPSYYGAPPGGQVTSPSSARYAEVSIEVLPTP